MILYLLTTKIQQYSCLLKISFANVSVYDVYYLIDLSPPFIELVRSTLNQIFVDGVARDAIIIGHGDFKVDPIIQDASLDRALQLTPVIKLSLNTVISNPRPIGFLTTLMYVNVKWDGIQSFKKL